MDDTTILGHFDLGSVLSPARAPRPRRTEGTHPDRLSIMRNVETPMGSGGSAASKPTVRKAEVPSRWRRVREAKASGRKATGTGAVQTLPQPAGQGRASGEVERRLTRIRWIVRRAM